MTEKIDTTYLSSVEIYKLVLNGNLKNFPRYYWFNSNTLKSASEIIEWLVDKKLEFTEDDIKKKLSKKLFKDNKLMGMLMAIFNGSPFEAINTVYPNKFKPWEFNKCPKNYWSFKTGKKAIKWLIEDKLKLNDTNIKDKLSVKLFINNKLGGMLFILFHDSPFEAINIVYPNKFKPWELNQCPNHYWSLQSGKMATKWLIEETLKLNDKNIKDNLSQKLFINNRLGGMLRIVFNNSPFEAINVTYPNRFKISDFKNHKNYNNK